MNPKDEIKKDLSNAARQARYRKRKKQAIFDLSEKNRVAEKQAAALVLKCKKNEAQIAELVSRINSKSLMLKKAFSVFREFSKQLSPDRQKAFKQKLKQIETSDFLGSNF